MDISILLATYKRTETLQKTLDSFCSLKSEGINWEVIVVDNACDKATQTLCLKYQEKFVLIYLQEKKQGKNIALNNGLKHASGDLILLTDDDIIADQQWLQSWNDVVNRWPENSVFGGRILPQWPENKEPFENLNDDFLKESYVIADWKIPEGAYQAFRVWGPNMAIRKSVFDAGWKFNEDIGPSGKNYVMGSETEFTKRLEKNGFECIYAPSAIVHHIIRKEQLRLNWLFQRAFRYGRSLAVQEPEVGVSRIGGVPRYLYKQLICLNIKRFRSIFSRNVLNKLRIGIEYWQIRGKIYQYPRTKV